jgi:hypothetical protein
MRQLFLAAIALLGLGVGSAYAQSFSHEAPPPVHRPTLGS